MQTANRRGRQTQKEKPPCASFLRLENSVCQAERSVRPGSTGPLKCGTVRFSGPVPPHQLKLIIQPLADLIYHFPVWSSKSVQTLWPIPYLEICSWNSQKHRFNNSSLQSGPQTRLFGTIGITAMVSQHMQKMFRTQNYVRPISKETIK